MHVDGRCHCGFISFEAEVDPASVRICNCTDCQTMSGTAFRTNVTTTEGSFRMLSGKPKDYVKVAESGRRRVMGFCPDCGTQIYSVAEGANPTVFNLRVGTLRQRDQLPPGHQIWWRSALPWVRSHLDDIPHLETDH